MGQPLTLDEVGVSVGDAAQCIYDLRRENNRLQRLLERTEPLLLSLALNRCEWRNVNYSYCPTEDCVHGRSRSLLAELQADDG